MSLILEENFNIYNSKGESILHELPEEAQEYIESGYYPQLEDVDLQKWCEKKSQKDIIIFFEATEYGEVVWVYEDGEIIREFINEDLLEKAKKYVKDIQKKSKLTTKPK